MQGSTRRPKPSCASDTHWSSDARVDVLGGEVSTTIQLAEEEVGATASNQLHSSIPGSSTRPMTRAHTRQLRTTYRQECDALPEPPAPLSPVEAAPSSSHAPRRNLRPVPFVTPTDTFGRYRVYPSRPLTIPDSDCAPEDFCDQSQSLDVVSQPDPKHEPSESIHDAIAPCPNISTYYFQRWFWDGNLKSKESREDLRQVMLQKDFDAQDLDGVNLPALDRALAEASYEQPESNGLKPLDGWSPRTVTVPVPLLGKGKIHSPTTAPIEGLFLRTLLGGIRKGFMRNDTRNFVYEPYQSYYVPPGTSFSKPQTIVDEVYTSPAMLEAHKEVQRLDISDAKCTLPSVMTQEVLTTFNFSKSIIFYL